MRFAPELASDPEFGSRFAREAKAISALNHPHICGLYDIGREHDTEYLVLELLEGEKLDRRIARGPLPLAQVLRFGSEIADAAPERPTAKAVRTREWPPGNAGREEAVETYARVDLFRVPDLWRSRSEDEPAAHGEGVSLHGLRGDLAGGTTARTGR
jgi:serine/threonine protein kinase